MLVGAMLKPEVSFGWVGNTHLYGLCFLSDPILHPAGSASFGPEIAKAFERNARNSSAPGGFDEGRPIFGWDRLPGLHGMQVC
jgi:hypothetical protein